MDKISIIKRLKRYISDIGFLEIQDKSKDVTYIDVNNICFVKDRYFIIIWDFALSQAKMEICKIPSEIVNDLYVLTQHLRDYLFPSDAELQYLSKVTNFGSDKDRYVNYFTIH